MKKTPNRLLDLFFLPALSGLLLLLSFPSFSLWFLALFAWVPLFVSLEGKRPRRAFLSGCITGLLFFGFHLYWLNYVTVIGYTLWGLVLSLIPAFFSMILSSLQGPLARPFWGALCWVALEYLRSIGWWSFSWGFMGHTLWQVPRLSYSAAWWGVYGLSFLLMATNLSLSEVVKAGMQGRRVNNLWLWPLGLLVAVAIVAPKTKPSQTGTMKVALVQGNYEQEEKWFSQSIEEIVDEYLQLSVEVLKENPNLIVWPETALPIIIDRHGELIALISGWVREHQVPLIVGVVSEEPAGLSGRGGSSSRQDAVALVEIQPEIFFEEKVHGRGPGVNNSAFLIKPEQKDAVHWMRYDKVHLVPYGESVPFQRIFPFLVKMVEDGGGGQYTQGNRFPQFEVEGARFGTLICFESSLAPLARRYGKEGVDFLLVITNDAWFHRSMALRQHAMQSAFRAIENGVPVLRATNTGWTCAFDVRGELIAQLPPFEQGVCLVEFQPGQVSTLHNKWGDFPVLLALGLVVGYFLSRYFISGSLLKRNS